LVSCFFSDERKEKKQQEIEKSQKKREKTKIFGLYLANFEKDL